jgi:broad specificity phosphatase PhoE
VAEGFDQWMQAMGYTREGQYYRVTGENTARTVAMFSHGGAGTAALARLFNMPFPYACEIIQIHFTSITVVELGDEPGALVCPHFELMGDCRHIEKGELEVYF